MAQLVLRASNYSGSMTINGDTFLDYLKKIHDKFPECYLFMDKASPHYKSKKVLKYFEENKDALIPVYLPTASPEFMVMEEIWNIAKRDLLVLKYYQSFTDFKNKISNYFRTKRFNLDMRNGSVNLRKKPIDLRQPYIICPLEIEHLQT